MKAKKHIQFFVDMLPFYILCYGSTAMVVNWTALRDWNLELVLYILRLFIILTDLLD
jgi:hypothetical protein